MQTFKKENFRKVNQIAALLFVAVLLISCSKEDSIEPIGTDICQTNPCGNPDQCPDECNSEDNTDNDTTHDSTMQVSRDALTPEGNVTETEDGYLLEGSLTIETEDGESIVFAEADLDVRFDEDGNLRSMSGSVQIPSPSNYFEFADPIRADIGYFSGKFLNDNRDFEIILLEDRWYFVFAIAATLDLNVGFKDDPDATKPISISPPVGGHITYIADYSDPMFFFSKGEDGGLGGDNGNGGNDGGNSDGSGDGKLLAGSFGISKNGNLIYQPTVPTENVVSFNATRVRGGTRAFGGVFEGSGLQYDNKHDQFGGELFFTDPLKSELTADYRSGMNGKLEFSLDIASFISFGFPIAEGSSAIVAEASTTGEVQAKAFVNGIVDPDLSWWPELIPVKPAGKLNTSGYVDQTGIFDIGLTGMLGLEMPSGKQAIDGTLKATNEAFTLDGQVTIDDEVWKANATFTTAQTRCIASPPQNFADGISETVTEQIDAAIATTEQALNDLEEANKNYEFELSLRGLRSALPTIIDNANEIIDDAVDAGIKSGRDKAKKILDDNNRKLCDDNISSKVNGLVKPYRDALKRLKNAVSESKDNNQTRIELEDALRDLAKLNKIDKSVTITIEHGPKTSGCSIKHLIRTDTRTVSINRNILSSSQINTLNEAAANVKYIAEADGIRFDAQEILDKLPSLDELENLKSNVETCVAELTESIGDVGFVYNHETKRYTHFMVINGVEKEVTSFDIFNGKELISNARLEVGSCNASEELNKLMEYSRQN